MVMYRVLKDFIFRDDRGKPMPKCKGDLVDVITEDQVELLFREGVIGTQEDSHIRNLKPMDPAKRCTKTLRVGIWLKTSLHYSGGRIHLYQYAWTLAKMGVEVYLITNRKPKWADDYPKLDNLRVVIEKEQGIPEDIDIVMTDSKEGLGRRALTWSRTHPQTRFVCLNFETANWAKTLYPPLGDRMQNVEAVYKYADFLAANSDESARWLQKAMDDVEAGHIPIGVFPPATNDYALAQAEKSPWHPPQKPYAFYAARGCDYKKINLAVAAVMQQDFPLDLVMMGTHPPAMPSNEKHEIHCLQGADDRTKYKALKHASVTLTPSLFEGYGMVPGESLCAGTPVLAFDLPVLRQVYGDRIAYAKHGSEKDYLKQAKRWIPQWVESPPEVDTKQMLVDYGMERLEGYADNLRFHTFKRKKVSAQLICYYGFVPESILSIAPYVDEIAVAFGRVPKAPVVDDGSKQRLEETLEQVKGQVKVYYEDRDLWDGKAEMRRWCCGQISGNHMLVLDGDEIWHGMGELLKNDDPFPAPRWVNFWHDYMHWIYDGREGAARWGVHVEGEIGSVCRHYRYSWWRPTYFFKAHPTPVDAKDNRLFDYKSAMMKPSPCTIYHLGHALPKKAMDAKHGLYNARDKGQAPARQAAWNIWKGETGRTKDGVVATFDHGLPPLVEQAFKGMQTW